MTKVDQTRREFLKRSSITLAALPLLIGCSGDTLAVSNPSDILAKLKRNAKAAGTEGMGAIEVPDSVTWRTAFKTTKDDGEPIIISGTVFKSDGKTPAPSTLIYFYHTDKNGMYGRGSEARHGRYRGWMLTDNRGRYEFASIRPASYPNSTQSQHVHMSITTLDAREDWYDSILFEGDRLITERERGWAGKRGGFNPIVTLERGKDGIMHATRDIQLIS